MSARLRVLHPEPARPHLALVDNVNCGDPIVAEAKRRNAALLAAEDLGIDLTPAVPARKRTARKRASDRNGPVIVSIKWEAVNPHTRLHALMLAGGDRLRCKPIDRNTVVVLNNPVEDPKVKPHGRPR